MKLILKNTQSFVDNRFSVTSNEKPCLDSSWHYHPQYELLYISKGSGIRYVGDSVSQFSPGDLVLVAPNVPHLWRNHASYYLDRGSKQVKTVVIKFTDNLLGTGTFKIPEFYEIHNLLQLSKFGVCFGVKVSTALHQDLMSMVNLSPSEQIIKILSILQSLSERDEVTVLSSTDMRQYQSEPLKRLDLVIKYISDNYDKDISLQNVADVACLTTNSFCRFFKKMTNKSFTKFLNEVRIRNASRLLIQDKLKPSEVCYKVGYTSMTNFYKQFKQIMGNTPKAYQYSV